MIGSYFPTAVVQGVLNASELGAGMFGEDSFTTLGPWTAGVRAGAGSGPATIQVCKARRSDPGRALRSDRTGERARLAGGAEASSGSGHVRHPTIRMVAAAAIVAASLLAVSCGEAADAPSAAEDEGSNRSAATSRQQRDNLVLTEGDAGQVIELPIFAYDIGLPDKKGPEIALTGDDASTLRWAWVQKPDSLFVEWAKVDGKLAFETDGLIGDPTTAAKVLEFRGNAAGQTTLVFELVERDAAERDAAERAAEPAKRLEYTFAVGTHDDTGRLQAFPGQSEAIKGYR